MQNSRFLRSIIVMQKSYNESLSKLYRKLYENEFITELYGNKDNDIDLENFSVLLPSPTSLNMTNLSDQLSTVSGVIDFVTQTLAGQNADPVEMDTIRKIVTKKYVTNVNWEEIENLIKENKNFELEEKLLKSNSSEDQNEDY